MSWRKNSLSVSCPLGPVSPPRFSVCDPAVRRSGWDLALLQPCLLLDLFESSDLGLWDSQQQGHLFSAWNGGSHVAGIRGPIPVPKGSLWSNTFVQGS